MLHSFHSIVSPSLFNIHLRSSPHPHLASSCQCGFVPFIWAATKFVWLFLFVFILPWIIIISCLVVLLLVCEQSKERIISVLASEHLVRSIPKEATQFSVVTQSCPALCNPMDCSTPGFPVHHQHPEFTQIHVHWVSDAIHPSHPVSSPSPPIFILSQHQGLFKWVSSSHQVAKVLEFQLQHQSFQWIFRTDFL